MQLKAPTYGIGHRSSAYLQTIQMRYQQAIHGTRDMQQKGPTTYVPMLAPREIMIKWL